jgi:hypothetical protein
MLEAHSVLSSEKGGRGCRVKESTRLEDGVALLQAINFALLPPAKQFLKSSKWVEKFERNYTSAANDCSVAASAWKLQCKRGFALGRDGAPRWSGFFCMRGEREVLH